MSLVALAPSPILSASPSPAPAGTATGMQSAEAPRFARLIEHKEPDSRAPRRETNAAAKERAEPEAATEDKSNAAEAEAEDHGDILAELEAMAAAAGQLIVATPVAAAASQTANGAKAGSKTAEVALATAISPSAIGSVALASMPASNAPTASDSAQPPAIAELMAALKSAFATDAKQPVSAGGPAASDAAIRIELATATRSSPKATKADVATAATGDPVLVEVALSTLKGGDGTVVAPPADASAAKAAPASTLPVPQPEQAAVPPTLAAASTDDKHETKAVGPDVSSIPLVGVPTPSFTPAVIHDPAGLDASPAVSTADQSITRHLDLARDTQWIDRLAQDISQAAAQQGQLKFHLNPEHLGALLVEISNGASGTTIRMTADNDRARAIIADAQPQLMAEVRAQGLRVADSQVDLSNQQRHGGQDAQMAQGQTNSGQNRRSSEDHKPFGDTQSARREGPGDSAPRDDGELYA